MSAVVRTASRLEAAIARGATCRRFSLCLGVMLALAMTIGTSEAWAGRPSCSVVLPKAGQTLSGNVTLDASASNAASVQYYLNRVDLGPAYATGFGWLYSPNSAQTWGWDTASVSNGRYSLNCIATASNGKKATSAPVTVTVSNPTGCSVVLPHANQRPSGVTTLDAAAPVGTTGVNFFLHTATRADVLIGPAYATHFGWLYSPNNRLTWGWDSSQAANGNVSITCEAIQPNNAVLSSTAVPVRLSNTQTISVSGKHGLRVGVTMSWRWDKGPPGRTWLPRIEFRHLPRRATLQVSCRGRGCARHLPVAHSGRLGRLLRPLERHTYWPGDRLQITISKRGYRPERIAVRIRYARVPAARLL